MTLNSLDVTFSYVNLAVVLLAAWAAGRIVVRVSCSPGRPALVKNLPCLAVWLALVSLLLLPLLDLASLAHGWLTSLASDRQTILVSNGWGEGSWVVQVSIQSLVALLVYAGVMKAGWPYFMRHHRLNAYRLGAGGRFWLLLGTAGLIHQGVRFVLHSIAGLPGQAAWPQLGGLTGYLVGWLAGVVLLLIMTFILMETYHVQKRRAKS
jgi:hypothetical protein